MTDEWSQLRSYVAGGSQEAFARLVERYVDAVYAGARRQVGGDAHMAEDVTQAVFLVLAQKAKSIPTDRPLSSWLLKVTGYCAANARRRRERRDTHERRAAEMARASHIHPTSNAGDATMATTAAAAEHEALAPLLDEGLARLRQADRDAILLKYFERKSLREVGDALGISEDAAQKRVVRAVDELRDFFRRRGNATVSAGALAAILATESVQAAPAGLTATVTASAASAATGGSSTALAATLAKGAITSMAMQKTTALAAAGLALLLGVGGGAVVVHSMFSGPSHRTFNVATPQSSRAATGPSSGGVVFTDGTAVQLIGVSELQSPGAVTGFLAKLVGTSSVPPAAATTWWAADGSAASMPPLNGFGSMSAGDGPGRRQVRFIFDMQGPAVRNDGLIIRIDGIRGMATSSRFVDGVMRHSYVASVSSDLDQTRVRFALGRGQWREDASASLATTTQPTTQRVGPPIFSNFRQEGAQFVIDQNTNRTPYNGDRESQLVVVLRDGKIVPSSEWRSMGAIATVKFTCRLDQVARVAWQTRPLEWAVIEGVALKPATAPAATTTRTASAGK